MGLIEKIKKGTVGLGLAGTIAISGCYTTPDGKIYDIFGNEIGRTASMTPEEQQRRDERLLMLGLGYGAIVEPDPQRAAAMGLTSQIMRDYDVAREGKSNVEIKITNPNPNNPNLDLSQEEKDRRTIELIKSNPEFWGRYFPEITESLGYKVVKNTSHHVERPKMTTTYELFGIKIYEKTEYLDEAKKNK